MTERELALETQQSAIYWIRCLTEMYPGGMDAWHPMNQAVVRLSNWLRADAKGTATRREWIETVTYAQDAIAEYSGMWFDQIGARHIREKVELLNDQLREWYQSGLITLMNNTLELTPAGRKILLRDAA